MKIRIAIVLFLYCATTSIVYAHGKADVDTAHNNNYTGTIYLYGEQHGVKKITDKELALWRAYYTKGLRHLFLELPSYTAEYLNMWLREKDNTILEEVFTYISFFYADKRAVSANCFPRYRCRASIRYNRRTFSALPRKQTTAEHPRISAGARDHTARYCLL